LHDDRGAAAVEFALVMIPLFLIVFGIIDFGRAFNEEETLTQAARVGARLATLGKDSTTVKNAVVNAAKTAVTLSPSNITVSGNCSGSDTSETVTVTDPKFKYVNFLVVSLPVTRSIIGRATAPC
jgi:Flp pilus assembly protein TadG